MIFIWTSYQENNASSWADFSAYKAQSRVAWKDRKNAERAARAHELRTGYPTKVIKADGRRWKGRVK